jgi:hypothetical protein
MTSRIGSILALPLLSFLSLIGCHGNPTEPRSVVSPACTTTSVFAGQAFYGERSEVEQEFSGVLEFRDLPATPNGRDHRYFLNGTAVYSGGLDTQSAFQNAAGTTVVVRGKLVQFTHGPEIWASTVKSCR